MLVTLTGAGCAQATPEEKTSDLTVTFDQPSEQIPNQTPVTDSTPSVQAQLKTWEFTGVLAPEEIANKKVRVKTAKGDIVFVLYDKTAPKAVSNFVYLTKGGYYNGLTFHRREEGFVIQGGDPNGNGTGGPGYEFEDELSDPFPYSRGIVAMANRGPNTNGSQFFIMLGNTPLPKAYTIFGNVTEGMDVVDQIQVGDKMEAVLIEDVIDEIKY